MGKHLVNGMPANPDIGDIYYDISDGRIKVPGDTAVHVFGGGKAYLLNDLHSLTSEATSDDIEFVIGSYDALRQAILDGMVIMDNRTMDYDYDRLVAVDALDGGNEMFISLAFHSGLSTTRWYTISLDNNGELSLTVTESRPFLERDTKYGMLETENKTVLGAINELYSNIPGGAGVNPLWCGSVSSTGVATKNSGTLSLTVSRSSTGIYSISVVPTGKTVLVSPLNYYTVVGLRPDPHTAVVSQKNAGYISVYMYKLDGSLSDFGFSLLIM